MPGKNCLASDYNLLTDMYCHCAIMVGIHNTKSGGVHQKLTHWRMSCREEVSRNQWERFISQRLPPADGQARTAALFRSHENDKFSSTLPTCTEQRLQNHRPKAFAELRLQGKKNICLFYNH